MKPYCLISDKNKNIKFQSITYKTPCAIPLENSKQIEQLINILKQNNIRKYKLHIENTTYSNKSKTKVPILGVTGRVALNTKIV